ncbi:alcohol dehydrogenase catalytic domain-containing protein [Streptomyces sp. NPDC048191]|uniref:zinc-dependent alcohol dehydrogenase n=1 Tax=Streptomyces sp. NPDC048191 TaxID=3155484 RepID=UPI0033F864A1
MTGAPLPATMTALQLTAPGQVRLTEVPTPRLRPGHCLVAVRYVGLCGTDLGFWDGSSNYLRDGLKSYPFTPGHEWSGRVVALAGDVTGVRRGDRVAGHNFRPCGACSQCAEGRVASCPERSEMGVLGPEPGAAAAYLLVPAHTLVRLPDEVDDTTAALLEPCSAGMHAVDRLAVTAADRVAVLGGGTLGLAAAQLARARGAEVRLYDPAGPARALAAELGIHAGPPESAPYGSFTAVIEASGAPAAVRTAPLLCAHGARLAQLGTPHHAVDGMPTAELVLRDLTLHGVLSGVAHWEPLLEAVATGALRLAPLIDTVVPLDRPDEAYRRLAEGGRTRPKVLLRLA